MKLYTRTGDNGTTGLFGAGRVPKDHPRVEAFGTVDEVNAAVGLAAAACDETRPMQGRFLEIFAALQSRLFDIGADLATPHGSKHESKIARIDGGDVGAVEGWIDEVDSENTPMQAFVLPGGTELSARLHLARTICRRAERRVVELSHVEEVNPDALIYLNRVSDLLFATARAANRDGGLPDVEWTPKGEVTD